MYLKLKHLGISCILLLLVISPIQAQDKYHHAILEGHSFLPRAFMISIDGTETKLIDVDKTELKTLGVTNLVIREIKKMEEDGWELLQTHLLVEPTTSASGYMFLYHFRKR